MFGAKKSRAVPIAVFDISSSSVGGAHALVEMGKEKPSLLLASSRIDAPLQEDLDMKRFVGDTVHNLEAVVAQLHKADVHKPSRIELVLASPWYVSQTRTISYKKDTGFLSSRKLINSLVESEIDHVIKNELERFGSFGKEGMVVEKQISLIKLNGYATGNPFGKRARTIDIFLTLTVVPKKIIDQFTDVLHRAYGTRRIDVTTSPYASFVAARDYLNMGRDAVFIDVGEEVTDVAFVKEGLFLYQHSFPVGVYGLYRSLMGKDKNTPAEARALVEGYRLGKISVAAKAKVEKALGAFSTEWQEALRQILEEGHYGFCLPDLCYITADARFEGVFPAIISTDPFIQHSCSRGKVNALFINEAVLLPHISSIDGILDVPLATASLFVARSI